MTQKLNKIYLEEVVSTNSFLLQEDRPNTICYSFNQIGGRGRHQSKWNFEKGKDIAFSISFNKATINQSIEEINLKTIISLLQLLDNLNINAQFKIPNDIYINGKKISGILIEHLDNQNQIVIGIGLNINSTNHGEFNSTSTFLETNVEVNLNDIVGDLTNILIKNMNKDIPGLATLVSNQNFLLNKKVSYAGNDVTVGHINDNFEISLTYPNGEIKQVKLLDFTTKYKGENNGT